MAEQYNDYTAICWQQDSPKNSNMKVSPWNVRVGDFSRLQLGLVILHCLTELFILCFT